MLPYKSGIKALTWAFCLIFCLSILSALLAGTSKAANLEADTVKSAFVLNFAKYTLWPEESFTGPEAPLVLWVFGNATTYQAFQTIHGKKVGTRKLEVRHMMTPKSLESCHMLFISKDVDRSILSSVLAMAESRPVLTIGEMSNFLQLGGVINLFSKSGRYRFEIKPKSAQQHGLKISSRLLKLAIIVGDK